MLRFDRYLLTRVHAMDVATGRTVDVERARADARPGVTLFASRGERTLIDVEPIADGRLEFWDRWRPPRARPSEDTISSFVELIDGARLGVPRAFDLTARTRLEREYVWLAIAREARVRGWIPLDAEVLGGFRRPPPWLEDRSLVIFAEPPGLSGNAVIALLHLARRDTRPHVLVRALGDRQGQWFPCSHAAAPVVHEQVSRFGEQAVSDPKGIDAAHEAAARWAVLLEELTGAPTRPRRTLHLAEVLDRRGQAFEAAALRAQVQPDSTKAREKEMVDDFVGVLRICQDVEDEQVALSRVGAYLRERLQASTVAFVARDSTGPRILTRIGSDAARVDLAVRSIETGVAIAAEQDHGPVESAYPVRHAAEVIGAVWCRWSAGTPVAAEQASSLLGLAAAAAAPSVRLAISKREVADASRSVVPEMVGKSPAMQTVREAIVRAAGSPFPVLIEGESGSGKELAARAIHAHGPRSDRRFCAINCAALVDDLVEAELFGHMRGAFTGAANDRAGLFEEANGGTLFLDEAAELGTRVQAKLLRALQEGEVRRLGEATVRRVDVRIVAATNRSLGGEVEAGRFRRDLWYRLDVIRILLPPLRSRLEDLPVLAQHIWRTLAQRTGSKAILGPALIAALGGYDWPGNVRELQNVLAALMVSAAPSGVVGVAVLPHSIARVAALDRVSTLEAARRQFDERYVRAALARAGGRVVPAARELGLSRQGLVKLMGRLGISTGISDNAV